MRSNYFYEMKLEYMKIQGKAKTIGQAIKEIEGNSHQAKSPSTFKEKR
jgi:hypothetical protein